MNDATLRQLREAARSRFAGTRIVLAYAYGSRVKGVARAESDLDIGYYLRDRTNHAPLPLQDEMRLADALSRVMGCAVDLRNLDGAPLELRGRVLEEGGRIFCADECERVTIERTLLGRYHDYKPAFTEMHKVRLAGFARGD